MCIYAMLIAYVATMALAAGAVMLLMDMTDILDDIGLNANKFIPPIPGSKFPGTKLQTT